MLTLDANFVDLPKRYQVRFVESVTITCFALLCFAWKIWCPCKPPMANGPYFVGPEKGPGVSMRKIDMRSGMLELVWAVSPRVLTQILLHDLTLQSATRCIMGSCIIRILLSGLSSGTCNKLLWCVEKHLTLRNKRHKNYYEVKDIIDIDFCSSIHSPITAINMEKEYRDSILYLPHMRRFNLLFVILMINGLVFSSLQACSSIVTIAWI